MTESHFTVFAALIIPYCMIARLCKYDNFFTYPTFLAL